MALSLSRSNEDYLEAILVLGLEQGIVRVRDLAEYLQVKAPSVATAMKKLAAEGLVQHEHYGHVELTSQGFELAEEIHRRHKLLFRFLRDFLGLDENTSSRDACEIEHWLSPQTITRIIQFLEFMEACPYDDEPRWLTGFRHFVETGQILAPCQHSDETADHSHNAEEQPSSTIETVAEHHDGLTLANLSAGQEAEVLQVSSEASLKRHFLELGIVPGTKIHIGHISLLDGSVEVIVRGHHLSLQKTEAARITVKRIGEASQ